MSKSIIDFLIIFFSTLKYFNLVEEFLTTELLLNKFPFLSIIKILDLLYSFCFKLFEGSLNNFFKFISLLLGSGFILFMSYFDSFIFLIFSSLLFIIENSFSF